MYIGQEIRSSFKGEAVEGFLDVLLRQVRESKEEFTQTLLVKLTDTCLAMVELLQSKIDVAGT